MLKFAARNLFSRPVRSLLSLLGLSVAIGGMVGLFAVAEGLDRMIADTFRRIPGLVAMQPGAPIPLFSSIPSAWGDEIAAVEGVAVVNPEIWQRVNVIESKMIVSPPRFLFGTGIDTRLRLKHGVYREEIIDGRFLTLDDRGTTNALISRQIAEEFDVGVGQTLSVQGQDLTIVGIYHCGSLLLDVAIIMDIETVRQMTRFEPNSVSAFYIEQQPGTNDGDLVERIRNVFRGRKIPAWQPPVGFGLGTERGGNVIGDFFTWLDRKLKSMAPPPSEEQSSMPEQINGTSVEPDPSPTAPSQDISDVDETVALEIRSAVEWASRFDKFSADLDLFLVIITGIGVTVAVLSVINTMLMSVSERIIEFGILKANGWSKTDVMRLITCESALIGIGGGVLGAAGGWVATQIINSIWPTKILLVAGGPLLLFSIAFSTALGILGGLYPAVWAMRLMPMDAIRRG